MTTEQSYRSKARNEQTTLSGILFKEYMSNKIDLTDIANMSLSLDEYFQLYKEARSADAELYKFADLHMAAFIQENRSSIDEKLLQEIKLYVPQSSLTHQQFVAKAPSDNLQ